MEQCLRRYRGQGFEAHVDWFVLLMVLGFMRCPFFFGTQQACVVLCVMYISLFWLVNVVLKCGVTRNWITWTLATFYYILLQKNVVKSNGY